MADNYLEKKFEDLRNGSKIIRKVNPSLDTLLSSTAAEATEKDPSYKVRNAQLNAMLASAARLGYEFEAASDEDAGSLCIRCSDSFYLGKLCLAAELKATELKLHTSTEIKEDADGKFPVSATIHVFR